VTKHHVGEMNGSHDIPRDPNWSELRESQFANANFAHCAPTESEQERGKAEKNGEAVILTDFESPMIQWKFPLNYWEILFRGPPGSRSRHLGIKRGIRMVGMVRWSRNHPRIKGNLSGGVGFVRWCRNGPWEMAWDF